MNELNTKEKGTEQRKVDEQEPSGKEGEGAAFGELIHGISQARVKFAFDRHSKVLQCDMERGNLND